MARYVGPGFKPKEFQKYCAALGLCVAQQKQAVDAWETFTAVYPNALEGDPRPYFACLLYTYICRQRKQGFQVSDFISGGNDGLQLTRLLMCADLRVNEFFHLMKELLPFIESGVVEQHFTHVQQHFCLATAMAHQYTRLFQLLFPEKWDDKAFQLGWLLFCLNKWMFENLHEDLPKATCVAIACVVFSALREGTKVVQFKIEQDSEHGKKAESMLALLCREMDVPFFMVLEYIRTTFIYPSSEKESMSWMEKKYYSLLNTLFYIDELPLIEPSCLVTQREQTYDRPTWSDVPLILESFIANARLANHSIEDTSQLTGGSSTEVFHARMQALRERFHKELSQIGLENDLGDKIAETCRVICVLKMEGIFKKEDMKGTRIKNVDLLYSELFHESLFALSAELVMFYQVAECKDRTEFPWIVHFLRLPMWCFFNRLDDFLFVSPYLAPDAVEHLRRIENMILTTSLWPVQDPIFNLQRNRQDVESDYAGSKDSYAREEEITREKVKHLTNRRIQLLGSRLGFESHEMDVARKCLAYALFTGNALDVITHVDQPLICSLYAAARVLRKRTQFKSILTAYDLLHFSDATTFQGIPLDSAQSTHGSIITYYNTVYLPVLWKYLMEFGGIDSMDGRNESTVQGTEDCGSELQEH